MSGLPAGASLTPPSSGLPPGATLNRPNDLPPGAMTTPPDKKPKPAPTATPSGLYSVNPNVNVVGDYIKTWASYGTGGIRPAFRAVVDGLSNLFHLGIYDFNQGHHWAPSDPHLDGRAMDVDTINGESVGTKLTPGIQSYITTALKNPDVRLGVPSQIYQALSPDERKRTFVDAPAHIHTELSGVQPGQTVAPRGFKPDATQGFVKDSSLPKGASALPPGASSKPPPLSQATNPMDAADPTVAGDSLGAMAHSGLMEIAGHQDLPFILANAQLRDANPQTGDAPSILEGMRNPKSHVYRAWQLYQSDPAQAMDEYGMGSPAQNKYMEQHYPGSGEGRFAATMQKIPFLNALNSFVTEQFNPMSWAEGGIAGKALGSAGKIAKVGEAGQATARTVGMGSPLYDLRTRGGVEASQWAKGTISSLNAPHELLHLPSTKQAATDVFGGLEPAAQAEVVRLKQGLKPNPAFEAQHADLEKRAKLLADDMAKVESHQKRTGILPPERTFNPKTFFPMKNSYDFGPQFELEQELRGEGSPGGGLGTSQHKVHKNLDQAVASGTLDEEFLPAQNYSTWRRQRLQRVAFEDAINRAPESIRRDVVAADFHNRLGVPLSQPWQQNINHSVQDTLDKWVGENNAKYGPDHPERYTLADNPQWVRAKNLMQSPSSSPALAKSMVAPQLWDFLKTNKGLQRYIDAGGSYLPGQEQTWGGRAVAMFRNAIVSNFLFHPAVNIAGNDSVARGIYNLGGPQFEIGGYAYNAAKSIATQFGLRAPEKFVGSAQEYSHWLDRAMVAGGIAEFGEPRTGALGGDYARVMTTPPKKWMQRAEKAFTKAGDFNRERTFGAKGEQAFAVSLFKDAVERGGMSDAKAGEVVREALGDYYNFDPKSPWSTFFFFMPWLKGNTKFWINTLVRRPQYATSTPHALRNYGMQTAPEDYQGAYPTGDFTVPVGGKPYTLPFVGRDIGHLAEAGRNLVQGNLMGAAAPGEQMLAGRATPVVRGALDLTHTIDAYFSPDVKGPETDWSMITNPKAPAKEQFHQAAAYFGTHFIPIPLFTYALQDAARKGVSGGDLVQALVTAGGAGYFGDAKLDDYSKRQLSKAQKQYKKAYDNYRFNDFGNEYLQDAWDTYTGKLRDLGVIH